VAGGYAPRPQLYWEPLLNLRVAAGTSLSGSTSGINPEARAGVDVIFRRRSGVLNRIDA
jgi:hypothetical protein